MMRLGKLDNDELERLVLGKFPRTRPESLHGPRVGEDCAWLDLADDLAVFSCDPITSASAAHLGRLSVHVNCNDAAAAGAEPVGLLVTLLAPPTATPELIGQIADDLAAAARLAGVDVIGGHTEVTDGVLYPVLTVTAAGGTTRAGLFDPSCVTADLDLVVTKGIALGAVSYLAKTRRDELLTRFSPGFIHGAADFSEDYSVCREAEIAIGHGVAAMQDLSEGGIFGALWEMADGAGIGLDVALKRILIQQETVEICEFFGVNPYQMLSTGALLIAAADGEGLVQKMALEGIPSAVIGRTTSGKERILRNGEEVRYLDKPQMDEMYRVGR